MAWVCEDCGSDQVEEQVWVKVLNGEIMSEGVNDDYWCPVCEEHSGYLCQVDEDGCCLEHNVKHGKEKKANADKR